jgi:8-oxo-dGTP pyrophosphatase MutT (NUDIX family)
MSIDRPTARVIVLDESNRVLLLRGDMGVWFMPGGGLEPGEDHAHAAARELWEETSLRIATLGPWVWTRRHEWSQSDGRVIRSIERFFVARTQGFTPRWARADDPERNAIERHRWWTVHEIAAATSEVFAPRRLAALLPPLLAGRLPETPLDV